MIRSKTPQIPHIRWFDSPKECRLTNIPSMMVNPSEPLKVWVPARFGAHLERSGRLRLRQRIAIQPFDFVDDHTFARTTWAGRWHEPFRDDASARPRGVASASLDCPECGTRPRGESALQVQLHKWVVP